MEFLDITQVTHPLASASIRLWKLFARKSLQVFVETHEGDRDRREFIRDIFFDNASSFSSEYDVQQLMSNFPREF